jgi:GTP cyclohydrolase IA
MITQTQLKQVFIDTHQGLSSSARVEMISTHISAILKILGLDLDDENLRDTPERVAKMYVNEIFGGLNPDNKPDVTLFENNFGYKEMLVEKNITFYSCCEHHLAPFFGKAYVGYFPKRKMIGLSKLNRFVQYIASKPQLQERLTAEIGMEMQKAMQTQDVAIVLEATHLCIASRGVKDISSITRTSFFSGSFEEREIKNEFLRQIDEK